MGCKGRARTDRESGPSMCGSDELYVVFTRSAVSRRALTGIRVGERPSARPNVSADPAESLAWKYLHRRGSGCPRVPISTVSGHRVWHAAQKAVAETSEVPSVRPCLEGRSGRRAEAWTGQRLCGAIWETMAAPARPASVRSAGWTLAVEWAPRPGRITCSCSSRSNQRAARSLRRRHRISSADARGRPGRVVAGTGGSTSRAPPPRSKTSL